jgi:hypothetical protein
MLHHRLDVSRARTGTQHRRFGLVVSAAARAAVTTP